MTARAHYTDMAALAALSSQPQVCGTLLVAGYPFPDASKPNDKPVRLDIYGTFDGEECEISGIALTATLANIETCFSAAACAYMQFECSELLIAEEENNRADSKAMQREEACHG